MLVCVICQPAKLEFCVQCSSSGLLVQKISACVSETLMLVSWLPTVNFSTNLFRSSLRQPEPTLTPEERDARTVFCMQLAARIRPRDLEDFFSAVGKVRVSS